MAYNKPTGTHEIALERATDRIKNGREAGETYVDNLESIRDSLSANGADGATLGTMVSAQLMMTETETQYMVEAGIPKKASGAHQAAAQDVKKAAG